METEFQQMPLQSGEVVKELSAALVKAQAGMGMAERNSTNPHFRSQYANLASAIDASRKVLTDNDLSVTQQACLFGSELYLVTQIDHSPSGEWKRSYWPLRPVQDTPQAYGSALTYARRYSYMAIIGLAPDEGEDDDGNAASEGEPRPARAQGHSPRPITAGQIKMIKSIVTERGLGKEILEPFGVESTKDLNSKQASELIESLLHEGSEE